MHEPASDCRTSVYWKANFLEGFFRKIVLKSGWECLNFVLGWTSGGISSWKGWSGTGKVCTGRWWRPHPQRCPRKDRTWHCVLVLFVNLSQAGLDAFGGPFQPQWFWDSVLVSRAIQSSGSLENKEIENDENYFYRIAITFLQHRGKGWKFLFWQKWTDINKGQKIPKHDSHLKSVLMMKHIFIILHCKWFI